MYFSSVIEAERASLVLLSIDLKCLQRVRQTQLILSAGIGSVVVKSFPSCLPIIIKNTETPEKCVLRLGSSNETASNRKLHQRQTLDLG